MLISLLFLFCRCSWEESSSLSVGLERECILDVYGSLQITTVIELCKLTYVIYPNMTFDTIYIDLHDLTNFWGIE
jgi:hypothetical protein